MIFRFTTPPPYHQWESLGDVPDPDLVSENEPPTEEQSEEMGVTSTTRRIIRSHSIPDNVVDRRATVTLTLMAQRRGNRAVATGEEWADIDSFVMSRLHANEHAKMEFGANQTKNIFLHLARRYKEKGTLGELLRDIDVLALDGQPLEEKDANAVSRLVENLTAGGKAQVWLEVIDSLQGSPELVNELAAIAKENPDAAKLAAASINLARYSNAIRALEQLIRENALEGAFQSLLEEHPWMFGSEYSEKLSQRNWIRGQQTDFMMRRTVDSYLELIEIKRPLGDTERIFRYDGSHRSWYPHQELSKVIGQVINYMDQLDAKRNDIYFDDGEQVTKVRAKVIIGRDHEQDQVDALKMFNSHLHRIEIFTFDQLLATAKRVRDNLAEELRPIEHPVEEALIDVQS